MFLFFIFFLGLAIGSFINALIYRLQKKEPIVWQRSHCPDCDVSLRWFDLVPLVSFFWLRGICRYCSKKISWQYPIVELATALLFVLVFWWQYPQWQTLSLSLLAPDLLSLEFLRFVYYLVIVSFLIVIFVYDLKTYLILDKVIAPAVILSSLALIWRSINYQSISLLWLALAAAFLGSGFFLLLVLISKGRWMGVGDIKLAFFMGLVLGWPNIIFALFLAFMSGAIVGLFLIFLKKKGLKSEIPFGPFLAGATVIVLLYGNYLTNLVSGFMMW